MLGTDDCKLVLAGKPVHIMYRQSSLKLLHDCWTGITHQNSKKIKLGHMQNMTWLASDDFVKWASCNACTRGLKPTLGTGRTIADVFEKSNQLRRTECYSHLLERIIENCSILAWLGINQCEEGLPFSSNFVASNLVLFPQFCNTKLESLGVQECSSMPCTGTLPAIKLQKVSSWALYCSSGGWKWRKTGYNREPSDLTATHWRSRPRPVDGFIDHEEFCSFIFTHHKQIKFSLKLFCVLKGNMEVVACGVAKHHTWKHFMVLSCIAHHSLPPTICMAQCAEAGGQLTSLQGYWEANMSCCPLWKRHAQYGIIWCPGSRKLWKASSLDWN